VRIAEDLETPIEFLTASPPMGLLLIKPAELMLFYTGADSHTYHLCLSARHLFPLYGRQLLDHNHSRPGIRQSTRQIAANGPGVAGGAL